MFDRIRNVSKLKNNWAPTGEKNVVATIE